MRATCQVIVPEWYASTFTDTIATITETWLHTVTFWCWKPRLSIRAVPHRNPNTFLVQHQTNTVHTTSLFEILLALSACKENMEEFMTELKNSMLEAGIDPAIVDGISGGKNVLPPSSVRCDVQVVILSCSSVGFPRWLSNGLPRPDLVLPLFTRVAS